MTSNRLLFFGNERLATGVSTDVPVLRALLDAGYDVAAVVSHNEITRSRKQRPLEIAAVAAEAGIPLLLPHRLSDVYEELAAFKADAGVLVAYGKIVSQRVIDVFPRGIINIHPSALPLHRGPTPLESVILDGSPETAVSLMALAAAMDAGPVYAQKPVALSGQESKQALADKLIAVGRDMVIEHLPSILNGSLAATAQDETLATYDRLIEAHDGVFNGALSAEQNARMVRAYAGWPRSRATVAGHDVIITAAHALDVEEPARAGELWFGNKAFGLHTASGVLVIDALIPAGKREISGRDFMHGYQLQN